MTIRRVLEELEVVDDINGLSKENLEKKYFADKGTYDHFLKTYYDYFNGHMIYPLRASLQFDKMAEVMYDGNRLYPSDDNLSYQEVLLSEMTALREKYQITGYAIEERIEAQYIFQDAMGSLKSKYNPSYEELVHSIKKGCEKYINKGEYPLGDFGYYVRSKQATCRSEAEVYYSIDGYLQAHPLSKACNDTDYLYFVNYMMSLHKNDVDEEFIRDAIDVINASGELQGLNLAPFTDRKEYNKLARHTIKTIRLHEKRQAKKEKKEIGLLKKKSK